METKQEIENIKKKPKHFKTNSLKRKDEIALLLHREISMDSF